MASTKILFTGSAEAGRAVASAAAPLLRPVTLELGGKDPMLVFRDCDVERTLAGALWGSFTNCGQVCSGAERIYVERPLYKRFTEQLAARASHLRLGQGDDPGVDLGPLITESQRDRVEEIVDDARANGAIVRTGGGRPEVGLPGWFYEPTVLSGERMAGRVTEEELFGPGGHDRALYGRGGGGAACERLAVRSRCERLDAGSRPREKDLCRARRRVSVDERHLVLVLLRPGAVGRPQELRLRAYARSGGPA